MICDWCAWEVDNIKDGVFTAKRLRKVLRQMPEAPMGHAACKGCTCHHKPVEPK